MAILAKPVRTQFRPPGSKRASHFEGRLLPEAPANWTNFGRYYSQGCGRPATSLLRTMPSFLNNIHKGEWAGLIGPNKSAFGVWPERLPAHSNSPVLLVEALDHGTGF